MASTAAKNPSGRPRKSPLRADTVSRITRDSVPVPGMRVVLGGKGKLSATDLRQMAISEFAAWLREQTNKFDRPFQEHTITNYTDAARTLDRWMTAEKVDEDFTACDTAMLNRFFARYLKTHSQGGTNTLQRNLAHLFGWLDEVYDHPNPYTARLNRYAPTKKRPATLAEEFIKDMLEGPVVGRLVRSSTCATTRSSGCSPKGCAVLSYRRWRSTTFRRT
jgi:integrase/recombinase XerD